MPIIIKGMVSHGNAGSDVSIDNLDYDLTPDMRVEYRDGKLTISREVRKPDGTIESVPVDPETVRRK